MTTIVLIITTLHFSLYRHLKSAIIFHRPIQKEAINPFSIDLNLKIPKTVIGTVSILDSSLLVMAGHYNAFFFTSKTNVTCTGIVNELVSLECYINIIHVFSCILRMILEARESLSPCS